MPRYRITDSTSGRTLLVEGAAPPTEADAEELFASAPAVAVAPPPDSANAAQSTADKSANPAYSPAASSWRNPYALDTGRPIVNARELGEPLMRYGLPLAAGLLAPVSGGASIPLGLAAAGAFTGEVLAQESEMARGARDQASYGQMVAAPIIAGTPLGPAFKGAAYAKDALIAARPAAVATRAAFGGAINAGADALAQKIDTGEVDSAQVLAAGGVGALFGGAMGALETATTTRAMKAALFAERKRTGDFKSTDLDLVGKMQRSWQRGRDGRGGPLDDSPGGGAGSVVPDQARPVDQVQLTTADLPPFDPTRSARDIVLPPVPPRPVAPSVSVAPVPPSAPAQVAPPEPLPAPVDNAPVVAPPASLPEPAPLAAPAQTSGVNQAPNVGDTITKPGVGGAPEVAPTAPASKPAITLPDAATAQTWVQRNEARFKSVSIRENPAGGFDVFTVSKGRRPGPGSHPDGETTDIIDHIRSLGGVPPPPKGATGGEWNGFKETFSGEGRALVNGKKRGLGFDQFLGNLANSDYAHLAGDPGGFYRTVSEAFADRARYKIANTLEENTAKFQTAILTGKGRGGREPKAGETDLSDNLNPGDKFSVKGEPITVTDVDPDGNVILQDGPRFKTQIIPPGVEIHPDARSMKKVPREQPKANAAPQSDDPFGDNFVPEPDAAPAAPAPGTQADLVAGIERQAAAPAANPSAPNSRPEPTFDDLISGRVETPAEDSYMGEQMQGAQQRWVALSPQERAAVHSELGTENSVVVQNGQFPFATTPARFAQIVDGIEAARAPAPAAPVPEISLEQQLNAAQMAFSRASTRFRQAGKWNELKSQSARQRWQVLKSEKLAAERTLEDLRAKKEQAPPPAAAPTPGTQADLVAGIERQAAAPALTLESASVGQQAAEAQAAREAQLVAKRRADMLDANDQPLTGDSSNVNQGQLYAADADMFSGASAQEMAAPPAALDNPGQAGRVGEDAPVPPAPAKGAWFDKILSEYRRRMAIRTAKKVSLDNLLKDVIFDVGSDFEGAFPPLSQLLVKVPGRDVDFKKLTNELFDADAKHWEKFDLNSYFTPTSSSIFDKYVSGATWYADENSQPDFPTAPPIQEIAKNEPNRIIEMLGEDRGLKWLAEVQSYRPEQEVVRAEIQRMFDNPSAAVEVREDAPAPQSQNPAAAAKAVGNLPGAAGGLDLPNAQGEAPAVALSRPPRGLKEIEAAIMRGTIDRDRAAALFNRWFDVQAGKGEWQQFWDRKGNPSYLSITDAEAQALSRAVTAFDQGTAKFKWPSTELRKKGGATGGHWSDPGPNDAEAGRIDPQLLFPLARAVVGGIAGYLEGDTPEEKLAYALAGGLGLGLLGSRRLARRTLAALKPARAPVPSYPFDPGKPLRAVNAQGVVVGSHTMGALEHVRAIEMPELVHLARQLSGNDVGLRNFPKASGKFKYRGTDFRIELDRRIFSDPVSAQRTMAHELGHMIDYLDDQTMNRGNLLGRIAVLRDHLATTLPDTPWNPNQALQPKERVRLRRDAEKEVGKRPAQDDEAALAAWKEAVAEEYVLLVQDEIESRGLIRDQEVRAELIAITEWWRPYEADKVSAGYIDYRNSSVELYADALSVLFNAPSELRDRAPLFFDSWMSYLDRKPEAKRALQDAWHFLHQGQAAVVAARDDRIKAGFVKAEEFLINHARERELDRTTLRGIVDQTKQEWWNIYQPIIARGKEVKAAGVKLPWHKDPEFFFDAHALAENENYLLLERLQRTVVAPLEASGQTRDDLGLYLFHNRVLNERYTDREGAVAGRSVIANPDGITPIQARMKLMLQRVPALHSTPEQRVAHRARLELLESSARQVQDAFADLVRNAHQAGVFTDEQLALTEANRYAYAPFAVVDYLLKSDHVPAGIKQQVGTLQKVGNPYLTFVLKGMAVAKLTELNRAKTLTVDLLNAHFPDTIERAPERRVALADGSMMNLPPPPAPRGKTTLSLLRKGKPEAYYVDPTYTKMFDDQMPASAHVVAKVLNYTMRNFFHPLFITYNPGFVYAGNPMSDNLRSYYALPPGAARRKWIAENRAVWESARSRVAQDVATQDMPRKRALVALRKQRPLTPAEATELKTLEARGLAYEAIATRALASPADSFAADAVNTDDLWSRMLRDHALLADEPGRVQALTNKYLPTVVKVAKTIERHGMMSEALPKLATYSMLGKKTGWSKEETAFYVRNQIGTPNVYKKGSRAVFNGSFLPYINVFTRGMEADVALLRGATVGPESKSRKAAEFWRRMTEASFVPSILQALAMVGVFGAALKKVYDGFSEYDKTNYLIIPLGTWETDTVYGYKSAGIRIRLTETMRFANAFLQHVVTRAADNDPAASASLAGLFEFGAGQVPGVHPLVNLGNSWAQFAAGIQPRDSFRGSPVVQTADWKAGGWDRTKGMLAYTWGESGLGGMVRFDPKSQNIMEFGASATPVVNRLIRWSDSGLREREERIDKLDAEVIYKIRSQMPKVVNELLQEYSTLQSMGERRDDRQEVRYKDLGAWHLKVWTPTYKEMKEAKPKDWSAYGVSLGIDSAPYGRGNQK